MDVMDAYIDAWNATGPTHLPGLEGGDPSGLRIPLCPYRAPVPNQNVYLG